MKEDAAETGFQNGSGQIDGEKLYVPASVIPSDRDQFDEVTVVTSQMLPNYDFSVTSGIN